MIGDALVEEKAAGAGNTITGTPGPIDGFFSDSNLGPVILSISI